MNVIELTRILVEFIDSDEGAAAQEVRTTPDGYLCTKEGEILAEIGETI